MLAQAAILVAGAGLVTFVVVLAATRSLVTSLAAALELFLAAGLLRLAGEPDLRALGVAATVLVLRRLVAGTLRADHDLLDGWPDSFPGLPRIWTRPSRR